MKSVFVLSLLVLSLSAPVLASEAVEAINPSAPADSMVDVAHVAGAEFISGLGTPVNLVTVAGADRNAGFSAFITVWDPVQEHGGSFGTFQTFNLGKFAVAPEVIEKRLRMHASGEAVAEVTLDASVRVGDSIERLNFIASITIKDGKVTGPLFLKRVK